MAIRGGGIVRENLRKDGLMPQTTEQLIYSVPGVSCGHCRAGITGEVEKVPGVSSVDVDLDAKRVSVAGERLDDAAIRGAIDEAGYDVA
jgi:copper chaperone